MWVDEFLNKRSLQANDVGHSSGDPDAVKMTWHYLGPGKVDRLGFNDFVYIFYTTLDTRPVVYKVLAQDLFRNYMTSSSNQDEQWTSSTDVDPISDQAHYYR